MKIKYFIILLLPICMNSQNIELLPGNINSFGSDFGFIQIDDTTAYYTSAILNSNNYQGVIYQARYRQNKWVKSELLKIEDFISIANINFDFQEGFNYFTMHEQEGNAKIVRQDKELLSIEILPKHINTQNKNTTQPFISIHQNQKTLYFVSDRSGGFGGLDIWLTILDKDNNFGIPINAGPKINSKSDEITPFYNHNDGKLYFSSNRENSSGGFDVYSSLGSLNLWREADNLEDINSEFDETHLTFFSEEKIYFSSNRGSHECHNIYFSNLKPINSQIKNDTINFNEYLPLNLYFHNDQPDCCTLDTITDKNYKESYISYFKMQNEYINFFPDKNVEAFFKDTLNKNFHTLKLILEKILLELNNGKKIKIKIKGYASPLHNTNYNINLSKRRVNSLINFIKEYNFSVFDPHLRSNKFILSVEYFGESKASKKVSDDPKSRNSIYGIEAMLERKIEIIEIICE